MGRYLKQFDKYPEEILDYDVDFGPWLTKRQDSIAVHGVTCSPGMTVVSAPLVGGTQIQALLSGGELNKAYEAQYYVATTGGRTKVITILVRARLKQPLNRYIKTQQDVLDYDIDFTDWMAQQPGDTVSTFVMTADSGITIVSSMNFGAIGRGFVSGGEIGSWYDVVGTLTTTQGRVKVGRIRIYVTAPAIGDFGGDPNLYLGGDYFLEDYLANL